MILLPYENHAWAKLKAICSHVITTIQNTNLKLKKVDVVYIIYQCKGRLPCTTGSQHSREELSEV